MRTLTLYLAALVSVLGIATAAQSAVIIDFEVGGSSTVAIAPSASVTVDIFMTATGTTSVNGYLFTLTYDTAAVGGANSLVNAPVGVGTWNPGGAGLVFDGGDGAIGASISASTLNVPGDNINAADGKVQIATIKFHVSGLSATAVSGCLNCDAVNGAPAIDAIQYSAGSGVVFNSLNIVPEPTTASLLGLGLLGLTVAGRRRN